MIRRLLMSALFLTSATSCMIIVEKDGGPGVVVPPPTVHAQMLVQVNVDPSVANMSSAYSQIIRTYQGLLALQTPRVWVDTIAIMPLNRTMTSGPRLMYSEDLSGMLVELDKDVAKGTDEQALDVPAGGTDISNIPAPAIGNGAMMQQLLQAAINSEYLQEDPNRAEHQNLAELGKSISTQIVYSPDGTNVGAVPPFGGPKDLFIVLTINHLRRPCSLGDAACQVEGQSPVSYFEAKDSAGHAAWLNFGGGVGLAPERIFHISIATEEGTQGEAFYKRCSETPGFPANFVDLIEPSPTSYYGPFASDFSPGNNAVSEDFCTMLGRDGVVRSVLTAFSIAGSLK